MGQKTHPYGFRIGYNKPWKSRWYAEKEYGEYLHEDLKLRQQLKKELANAQVSDIEIERSGTQIRFEIYTARPGIIIGKKGKSIDDLRDSLQKRLGKVVHINVNEIQRPEIEAQLIAQNIAQRLERRVSYRRAMKKAIETALRFGALGVKIRVAGRLNGAEIARALWYQEGRLPLQTLKANVDYGFEVARTTYGVLGIKVWVYKGDQYKEKFRRI